MWQCIKCTPADIEVAGVATFDMAPLPLTPQDTCPLAHGLNSIVKVISPSNQKRALIDYFFGLILYTRLATIRPPTKHIALQARLTEFRFDKCR